MAKLLTAALCILGALISHRLHVYAQQDANNFLDVETPNFFQYNSPLLQPNSLRSPKYYEFLKMLYGRDASKADLFVPYGRPPRHITDPLLNMPSGASVGPAITAAVGRALSPQQRTRRAIVFRPLFFYKQQQIRREEFAKSRRRI